ncbi:uncharacterized protein OCT59_013635 [Rhizophagus irregularis]|uniref:uncharacterized protein n=1 Tax=Rhizophagus irregularis TaxID=588596 RepID=UPI00331FEEDC|nr:hypothetical protein OCT59_013635 [Rhizophagus irregularis]
MKMVVENVLVTGNSVVKGDETYMKDVVETGESYNLIVDIDPSENMTEIFSKWDTETINRLQNFLLLF